MKFIWLAMLAGSSLTSVALGQDSEDLDVAELSKLLTTCESSLQARNFSDSIHCCRKGIGIIGQRYLNEAVVDDTGMSLTLAQVREKQGKLEEAAVFYRRVFANRLSLLLKKSP